MARVIPLEELLRTSHGIGYHEEIWPTEGQAWKDAMSTISDVVWIHGELVDDGGILYLEGDSTYNKYFIPTLEDVEREDSDDRTVGVGHRVWDEKPSYEEMKSTPWEVAEQ